MGERGEGFGRPASINAQNLMAFSLNNLNSYDMVRLRIHPSDIKPLLKNIHFDQRKCSDGQCCSYDLDDPDLPEKPFDKYYWVLEYRHKLYSYVHYLLRAGCPDLEVSFSEDNGKLYMGTSCRIYSDRPQECKDFGTRIKCNFQEYVACSREKGYYYFLFLLVLEEKYLVKYPFLRKFNLPSRYLQMGNSIAGTYISNGIYIPMPADERILPNQFPHIVSPSDRPS